MSITGGGMLESARFSGYVVGSLVAGAGNLVLVPVWLNLFGPEAYGRYAVTWAVSVAACAASVGWLRQAALRTSGIDLRISDLPRWSLVLPGLASAGLVAAVATALGGLQGADALAGGALGASLVVGQLVTTTLQQRDRAWMLAASEVLKLLATVVVTISLSMVTGAPGHVALVAGVAGGNLALLLTPGVVTARWRGGDRELLRSWWSYGWPLSLWLTMAPVLLYADRLVLQLFAPAETVGAFAALSDLVVRGIAVLAAPVVVGGHVWVMRRHNAGDVVVVAGAVRRTWLVLLAATVLAAMAAAMVAEPLAKIVGISGLPLSCLPLLVLGGGLWQVALFAHKPLELAGRTKEMMVLLASAVVLEVAVCVVLVPDLGAVGAVTGLVAGVCTYIFLALARSRQVVTT